MDRFFYPIFKLPEYYNANYEKEEIPRYIKWWLYKQAKRKHNEELSDIIYGTNFSLLNTLPKKFNILEIQGNTEQDTLTGRNKLDGANPTGANYATVTMQDNIIKVSSTATNTTPFARYHFENLSENDVIRISGIVQNTNGKMVFQLYNGSTWDSLVDSVINYTNGTDIGTFSYTVHSPITGVRVLIYADKDVPTGATESNYKNVIVTKNNSNMNYEPYCGGTASPNPEFPQQIKNVEGNVNVKIQNKNLWNNELETAEYNSQGEKISTVVWVVNTQKIKVKPNTTYSVSQKETPSQYRIIFFSENNFISRQDNTQNTTTGYTNYSFTTPNNCNYIYIQFRSTLEVIATGTYDMTPSDITEVQLEENATATNYVEHQEQNLPFTLASGQKLMQGGSLQDDGIHNVRGQIVLDGTEDWTDFSYTSGDNNFRVQMVNAVPNILTPPTNPADLKCNYFKAVNRDTAYIKGVVGIAQYGGTNGGLFICAPISILSTQDMAGWKTWLSTHNLIVEFPLAEEVITPYTETQATQFNDLSTATTYSEQTNIESSSSGISPILKIQYYKTKEN